MFADTGVTLCQELSDRTITAAVLRIGETEFTTSYGLEDLKILSCPPKFCFQSVSR